MNDLREPFHSSALASPQYLEPHILKYWISMFLKRSSRDFQAWGELVYCKDDGMLVADSNKV